MEEIFMMLRKQLTWEKSSAKLPVGPALLQLGDLPETLKKCILPAIVLFIFKFAAPPMILRSSLMPQPNSSQDTNHTRYSYIDKSGKVVIDADKYDSACNFKDGLAAVYAVDKGWGFIDIAGNEVIEPQFESAMSFSEGLAGVQVGELWGFIDKTGRVSIKPQYNAVSSFSEEVAVVLKGNDVGLIGKAGQSIFFRSMNELELNIYENARLSEGLLVAFDKVKSKSGFIDKTGKYVIEPKFDDAAPFSEGLARVTIKVSGEGKVGFIDHNGQFAIPPKFNTDAEFHRNSTDFSEGLASLTENLRPTITKQEKFVYIDKKGTIVFFTNFFYAGPFRDGLAVVYDAKREKWGYIDKSGKVAIPIKYDVASDFSEGLAVVAIEGTK
jgi:hypothetical protein